MENAPKPLVKLDKNRYISMEDNIHLPAVVMSFPTVYARHEDEPALDLLAEILGVGKTSLLYKNLVKNGVAVQSQVSHSCQELACNFFMFALPNPAAGKTLAELEAVIRASFKEFEERGVTDDDLAKVKAKRESNTVFGLQSVRGKVSQLAFYETFTGNPNYISKDITRYNEVTKDDVVRVYNTYLKDKPSVILSVVPNGKLDTIAHEDTFVLPKRDFTEQSTTDASQLNVREATDNFDRSAQPKAGANPLVTIPDFWEKSLTNGISVLGTQSLETPTTSLLLKIPAGHLANTPAQAGLANITTSLLNEATTERSNESMSLALQKLGSSIRISAGGAYTNVFVSTLSKNLDETMALVLEKLTKPAFNDEDFNRIKGQTLQNIQNARKDANALAAEGWSALLFGNTIAGVSEAGTLSSVANITQDDVKGFYADYILPATSQLIVVSDLPQAQVAKSLSVLQSWTGTPKTFNRKFDSVKVNPDTVYVVNKEGAAQSVIRIGKQSLPRDFTGEFFKADLMNFNLGGAFNSRINLNLREDKGYTYGARAGFRGDKEGGIFMASAAVRADVTDDSFVEFKKEITAYQDKGMTQDELAFMQNAVGQRDALSYETPNQKLGFMADILEYNLPKDFTETQADIIQNTAIEEFNALAKKHLDFSTMAKLVVGDATTLKPEFEALGYKVEILELPK